MTHLPVGRLQHLHRVEPRHPPHIHPGQHHRQLRPRHRPGHPLRQRHRHPAPTIQPPRPNPTPDPAIPHTIATRTATTIRNTTATKTLAVRSATRIGSGIRIGIGIRIGSGIRTGIGIGTGRATVPIHAQLIHTPRAHTGSVTTARTDTGDTPTDPALTTTGTGTSTGSRNSRSRSRSRSRNRHRGVPHRHDRKTQHRRLTGRDRLTQRNGHHGHPLTETKATSTPITRPGLPMTGNGYLSTRRMAPQRPASKTHPQRLPQPYLEHTIEHNPSHSAITPGSPTVSFDSGDRTVVDHRSEHNRLERMPIGRPQVTDLRTRGCSRRVGSECSPPTRRQRWGDRSAHSPPQLRRRGLPRRSLRRGAPSPDGRFEFLPRPWPISLSLFLLAGRWSPSGERWTR